MTYRILFFLSLIFSLVCASMGAWRLQDAITQEIQFQKITARQKTLLNEMSYQQKIQAESELNFFGIQLRGFFDNAHNFLMENQTQDKKMGYEVFSPFYVPQLKITFLIDRGFFEANHRQPPPALNQIIGTLTLQGFLLSPESNPHTIQKIDTHLIQWPAIISSINLNTLSQMLHTPLSPYLVKLNAQDPLAYDILWQFHFESPKKPFLSALEWFAFSGLLVISCLVFRKFVFCTQRTQPLTTDTDKRDIQQGST